MAIIKKTKQEMLMSMGRNPYTLLVECKLVQPLWKSAWRFLKTPKLDLLCDPAIPLLGIGM
jgi:hypothetical protein